MTGPLRVCSFCNHEGARRLRLDVFPWDRRHLNVCAPCVVVLPSAILKFRREAGLGLTALFG